MIALKVNKQELNQLSRLLKGKSKQLRKNIAIAINDTAKSTVSFLAKGVSKEIAVTQKVVRKTIGIPRKASDKGFSKLSATVRQKKTDRIPLRDFGAKQTKVGVSYRVTRGKGKKPVIPSAFIVNSIGGHAFKRVGEKVRATKGRYKGKMRQPIIKLFGASPWGVVKKNGIDVKARKAAEIQLTKELKDRIRVLKLKQSGVI